MTNNFKIAVYDFESAEGFALEAGGAYFAFAPDRDLVITSESRREVVSAGDGRFIPSNSILSGNAWLFALTPAAAPQLPACVACLELSAGIFLDESAPLILRADAVTSASGSQTPRHGHRGPGIRRLLKGLLLAEVGDIARRIGEGDAWFESGDEWVIGSNISGSDNTFIRVMVLPSALRGGLSSFVPASDEEAMKPRTAQYHLFGEISL